MPSNVEIKAKLVNKPLTLEVASQLSDNACTVLKQKDTFYKVPNGRLKLRVEGNNVSGQLITYARPDKTGPKLSTFSIANIENAADLNTVLKQSLGVIGLVAKERMLFIVGQTRIHIDTVDQLGDFLELEVMMKEGQAVAEGERIAGDFMEKLGVRESELITGAYMDLLLEQNKNKVDS